MTALRQSGILRTLLNPVSILAAIGMVAMGYAFFALGDDAADNAETVAEFPDIPVPNEASARGWIDSYNSVTNSIRARGERVAGNSDDWGVHAELAQAYADRGQLTGNYSDLAMADREFDTAFSVASPGAGPHLARANFNFQMHRLTRAAEDLSATEDYGVPLRGERRAQVLGMLGDIEFYRGNYANAVRQYEAAAAEFPGFTTNFRFFNYFNSTGNDAEAARYLTRLAEEPGSKTTRRFVAINRGRIALFRGQYDVAAESFRAADRLFPGDWRTEALVAQMDALSGDLDTAIPVFERIANERGSPEAMGMLATIYDLHGEDALSAEWAQRGTAAWEERLSQFPEAAYGHALDHHLSFGRPERALELAEANWRTRPYGDAAIGLIKALLANDRNQDALRATEALLASSWDTAEVHALAAEVYDAAGELGKATAERAVALSINPRVLDEETALIWFGH